MKNLCRIALGIACVGGSLSIARAAVAAPVITQSFGQTPDGKNVQIYTLRNAAGYEARITNYGGILVSLKVPDRHGKFDDVVLGFDTLEGYTAPAYRAHLPYFGALIGRYANRIARGRFHLDGHAYQLPINDGVNSLHGGKLGFDQAVWSANVPTGGSDPALELTYKSRDQEQGYPGNVFVKAVYTLRSASLELVFTAVTDKPTIVNLTNHSYFNLKGAGNGDILDHELQILGDTYTPIDATSIPLAGPPRSVVGTPFDFRQFTKIGARIAAPDGQLEIGRGYDHNFVAPPDPDSLRTRATGPRINGPHPRAYVAEATQGRTLEVWSNQPGTQFYSGNFLNGTLTGKGGKVYGRHAGFCLEPQLYPNSPNRPDYPSAVLRPGHEYEHTIIYKFGVMK